MEAGATRHSATPKTRRRTMAVQNPVFELKRDTKEPIPAGEARPKTPIPMVRFEIIETMDHDGLLGRSASSGRISALRGVLYVGD